MHVGPLALTPTVALTNVGVDDNVFNEANQYAPKRDFTFTVTPQTGWWLRLGPTWLSGTAREDFVYFNKYTSERAINQFYGSRIQWPLNRLRLHGGADYLNTRDRPGFEIDGRSQRYELGFSAGIEAKVFSRTLLRLDGRRHSVNYDKAEIFRGNSLHFDLNRTVQIATLTVRQRLTPLTSVVVTAERERARFAFNPLRDSNSTQVSAGVIFESFAPISGQAMFGRRIFTALGPGVPHYGGLVASIDLVYTALETMTISLQAARQLEYSFDLDNPYYIQSGAGVSVTKEVYGPIDVVGRIGIQRLDYRNRMGVTPSTEGRTDYMHLQGGGVGYHFSTGLRVGLNVDRQVRTSALADRSYGGLRYGTAVTYRF